jgi:sugar lactone lactonase YvrE
MKTSPYSLIGQFLRSSSASASASKSHDLRAACRLPGALWARCSILAVAALATAPGLLAQANYATPYTFTTLLGKAGVEGNSNGTGASALLAQPLGLAVDTNGNLYVADSLNQEVRKVTGSGVVTTLVDAKAIAAAVNFVPGPSAHFSPYGLAVDSAGNVYISDLGYAAIWMVSSAGVVTPVAGGSVPTNGIVDGVGNLATFGFPRGIALDASGNLFVGDGYTIRKITLNSGRVNTLAGSATVFGDTDGTGSTARFGGVNGVAVDASGNVYAADGNSNFTIRKITQAGVVTTIAGTGGTSGFADGTGGSALFFVPNGIAADSNGNLYVTVSNNTIRRIASGGVVTTLAGTNLVSGSTNGTGASALFNGPVGIAVDANGDLFVADTGNNTVRERYAAASASPTITVQPVSQSVAIGAPATFSVQASGVPTPQYQWQFNSANIGGATNPSLTVLNVQATNLGTYSVVVSNSAGSATSNTCALSSPGVSPAAAAIQPRLVNISSRAYVDTGANVEIAGFVIVGPPGSTDRVLIRAIGPSLAQFGVGGTLAYPVLTLFNSNGAQVGTNESWANNANFAQIVSAETITGAFALSYTSNDAAMLVDLAPGSYTAEVSATANFTGVVNAPGVALAEVYEVSSAGAQIINISTRAYVGTGSNVEISGIVVTGTEPASVLIRAIGPALAQFGVSGALAKPSLSVTDSGGNTIATNTGWSSGANAAAVSGATVAVGAFALPSGSADCALLLTLLPGSYTAIVSGVGGTSGVALVEAYQAGAVLSQ